MISPPPSSPSCQLALSLHNGWCLYAEHSPALSFIIVVGVIGRVSQLHAQHHGNRVSGDGKANGSSTQSLGVSLFGMCVCSEGGGHVGLHYEGEGGVVAVQEQLSSLARSRSLSRSCVTDR
jgi:hypothetical protein